MSARRRNLLLLLALVAIVAIAFASYRAFSSSSPPTEKSLTDLIRAADHSNVVTATIKSSGTEIIWNDDTGHHYTTVFRQAYPIENTLIEHHIKFTTEPPTSSDVLLSVILPNLFIFLIIGAFMWYMLRQTGRLVREPLLEAASTYLKFGGSVDEAVRLYRKAAEADPELHQALTVGSRDRDAAIRQLVEVAAHSRDLASEGTLRRWSRRSWPGIRWPRP